MNILLIDDEEDVRYSLSSFVKKLGHEVHCAKDGKEGWEKFHERHIDLVITDIRMPGMDGLELLRRIKKVQRSPVVVIVITGHGDMENAIKALKYGAYDYLQKPVDVKELAITIERAIEYSTLRKKYLQLKNNFHKRVTEETENLRGTAEHFREAYLREVGLGEIQVCSDAMGQVIDLAEKYSRDRTIPVLIEGESGTGKELIAKLIHYYGQEEAGRPFVPINCGAISQELFEGELFGHEPGAYTGATAKGQMGKIEAANGGTFFLDEIGEMPLNLQVKLLRVVEEKELFRLGGVTKISVDVRVISATNKDLHSQVQKGLFRLDLFHRINMGFIRIPPLRERRDDILPLARHFIRGAFARRDKQFDSLSEQAERLLQSFPWPGNVRQLKNTMERLSILTPNVCLDVKDVSFITEQQPDNEWNTETVPISLQKAFELPESGFDIEAFTSQIIREAFKKNGNNKTRTAKYLGISRRVLEGRLKNMGL